MARRSGDDLTSVEAPDLACRVGERLRTRRAELGWTLAETARDAAISVSYLSSIENGNNLPSLPILIRVAGVLDVSLNELLRDVGGGPAPTRGRLSPERQGAAALSGSDLQLTVASVVGLPGETGACPVPTGRADLFVHALEGTMEVIVDREPYSLQAGDSLDAEAPSEVTYRIAGDERSVAIWAAAPSAAVRSGDEH